MRDSDGSSVCCCYYNNTRGLLYGWVVECILIKSALEVSIHADRSEGGGGLETDMGYRAGWC